MGEKSRGAEDDVVRAVMLRALSYRRLWLVDQAAADFRALMGAHPDSALGPYAGLFLAYQHLLFCRLDEAESASQDLMRRYSPGEAAGYAQQVTECATRLRSVEQRNRAAGDEKRDMLGDKAAPELREIFAANTAPPEKISSEAEVAFKDMIARAAGADPYRAGDSSAKGDSQEAASCYLQALRMKPAARDNTEITLNLARIYWQQALSGSKTGEELHNGALALRYVIATAPAESFAVMQARAMLIDFLGKAGEDWELCLVGDALAGTIPAGASPLEGSDARGREELKFWKTSTLPLVTRYCIKCVPARYPEACLILGRIARRHGGTEVGYGAGEALEVATMKAIVGQSKGNITTRWEKRVLELLEN